ncbi:MAG: AAA family ATPase [bacterium]|nr:AAA family ATPase [bacterium]
MHLQSLELSGFKSFARKTTLSFAAPITAIVGPNGSGKSNSKDALQWVLGEQSIKSLRGKRGEDLIWNGSTGVPRSSRASVALTFDNSSRVLALDLDTVVIERVVHRDGVNEYALNGSRVRLRDVAGLLAQANIGSTGHHIISQGEADRILACSASERRAMIEDALGLRVYHYKLAESVKKLAETKENIRSVEALRREIAPHLRFLKKQAARLERARSLARDLVVLYRAYFVSEEAGLRARGEELQAARTDLVVRRETLHKEREALLLAENESPAVESVSSGTGEIEAALRDLRAEREKQSRELGRIEGVLEMLRGKHAKETASRSDGESLGAVPLADLEELAALVGECLEKLKGEEDLALIRDALERLRERIAAFVAERRAGRRVHEASTELSAGGQEGLGLERERITNVLHSLAEREQALGRDLREREAARRLAREREYERERVLGELETRAHTFASDERALAEREAELRREELEFKREQGEAAMLLGREVVQYDVPAEREQRAETAQSNAATRAEHERARRDIERLRIRLEEAGSAESIEAQKEYEATAERDAFFERELGDLAHSRESLETLMDELRGELESRFRDGLARINEQFQEFFSLLFDGGRAAVVLSIPRARQRLPSAVEDALSADSEESDSNLDNESPDVGLDVEISLPRKRLRGLEQLSGGERALTSIALIFAISQVHPPPFLILDETDAALDEANSRRYGDMIERLAERSQLILITHNRETMSRASVLYGVTMGVDGVSQLLSIKFDADVAVTK